MKLTNILAVISLVASLSALSIALSKRPPSPSIDERLVREIVEKELKDREKAYVARYVPRFKEIFKKSPELIEGSVENWNPETIDQLMDPFFKILIIMGEE